MRFGVVGACLTTVSRPRAPLFPLALQTPHTVPAGGAAGNSKLHHKGLALGGAKPRFNAAAGAARVLSPVARLSEALCADYDPDDPAAFLLAQGFAKPLVEQALAACGGDEDEAQIWLMHNHVAYQPSGGAARGPGCAAVGLSAAQLAEQKYMEEQEAKELQDLHNAQVASELESEQAEKRRNEQFKADARLDPVGTFLGSSVFLREVMQGDGAACPDELKAHTPVLAELLLLEKFALRQWERMSHPYFEDVARQFKAQRDGQQRGLLLARWVSDIGDPRKPGSIYGMPVNGQGAGLPPALHTGPLEVDDIIVLD